MSDRQTMYTMQRIGGLLFRKLHDDITEGEQVTLDSWLDQQDAETRRFFAEATDWDSVRLALQSMYAFDVEAAYEDVQKKIQVELMRREIQPVKELVHPRVRWVRWLSAAAVLLVMALVVDIYMKNGRRIEKPMESLAKRYKNDVGPGGDKAILRLGDGREIVLDSIGNGQLAKEGGTKIVKVANGEIVLDVSGTSSLTASYNLISTPKGGQYQIKLSDGTRVWLNAASSLRFPTRFIGNKREVEITGEAYFEVAKNSSLPFKVLVSKHNEPNALEIEVLGTEFDIMAYADESDQRMTLVNGAVTVGVGPNKISPKPSEQVRVKNGAFTFKKVQVDVEEVAAWKNGFFRFQEVSIEDIMRQAARWYDIDVVYNGKIDQQFIGAIPRRVNLSTMLKILESTGWVHFTIEGKKVMVNP